MYYGFKIPVSKQPKKMMLSHTIAEESHNSFCPLFGEVGGRVRDMFLVKQEALQASTPESKKKVKK